MVVGGTNSLSVKQERFCISTCPGFHYQSESWKENSALHRRSKGNLLQRLPEDICPCSFNSFIWCPQQQGILLLISVLFQGINLPKNPHSFAKPGEFFRLPSCLWTTDGCIYWTTALVKSLRDSLPQTPTFSTTWAWFISFSRLSFWHKNQASPEKQKTSSACPFLHALYLYMLFPRSLGYPSFVVHRKVGDKTSESCHRSAAEVTLPAAKHIKSPGYLERAFIWSPPAITGKTSQNPTQTHVLTANKVSERKRKYKQTAFVSEVTAGRNKPN